MRDCFHSEFTSWLVSTVFFFFFFQVVFLLTLLSFAFANLFGSFSFAIWLCKMLLALSFFLVLLIVLGNRCFLSFGS